MQTIRADSTAIRSGAASVWLSTPTRADSGDGSDDWPTGDVVDNDRSGSGKD